MTLNYPRSAAMGVFLGTRERVRNSRGKRPMMNPIYVTATMKNDRVASPESVPIPLRAERISVLIRPRGYKKNRAQLMKFFLLINVKFISGKK